MPPIRLTYLLDSFQLGGTELNAVRTAEHLDPALVSLSVVHFREDGPLRERYERLGVPLRHLPLRGLVTLNSVSCGTRLAGMLRESRAEILHSHDVYGNIFGVPWARFAGVRCALASRRWLGSLPRPGLGRLNRWACRAAHGVLANSSDAVARIREEGVRPSRIRLVPNFVDESFFRPPSAEDRLEQRAQLGFAPGDTVIGIVGRLAPVKNHALLLEAFRRIGASRADLGLLIIGDGECAAALKEQALQGGLAGRIRFAGALQQPPNLHFLADIAVMCSDDEGFPNVVLEAMAAARPVVATDVGGMRDAIQAGHSGVVVPPGNAEALAAAMASLADHPHEAAAMGAAAREVVLERFTARAAVSNLMAWYRELTGRGAIGHAA